ncbi:MAG: Ribose ABC transport system, permease protein RbsC [uncultured Rubrobacteraceae bacterium]|uniref:Ribose ABC transport system, permease protein RbsC n=1 Tax=uncultured Rubrobacteraceae bacterium TaxID=349277 RepID=A0A6J4Q8D0_9ACTN|nr:MAG: Ribose ABC transport system, permease protein RbsC [uncultured Rubrobacteraceae bacterium]
MAESGAAGTEPGKTQAAPEGSGRRGVRGIPPTGTGPILAAWLLLCVVLAFLAPNFLQVDNLAQLIAQWAVVGIAAVGVTFVIITAGIDLSVGAIVALTGMLAAISMQGGVPGFVGILVALGAGLLIGAFNGFSTAYFGIAPFIVTLAVLSMGRGLTLAVSGGQTVFGFPASFTFVGRAEILGVSLLVWLTLAVFATGYLVLSHTAFGRQVYAVGGDREAARLAGIPVRRVTFLVYAISGLCAGLSAVVLTSRLNSALPSAAEGLELQVIAAVVIGGASLFGGRGSMVGTLVGVLLIGTLNNGLTLLNVPPFWVQFVHGAVVFLAVLVDALNRRRRGRAG